MVHCCILGCKSHSARRDESIAFHRFPSESSVRNIWIKATGRQDWQPTKETRICSKHFESQCYKRTNKCTLLNYGSVPKLLVQSSEEMEFDIIESKASVNEQTSNRMTRTMGAVDEGAAPVKEEPESGRQHEGGAGDHVQVKTETLEVEVGPEQLQPQDIAWAVKEEPGSDEDESGLAVDEGQVKMELEPGPEELRAPGDAGRPLSTGRTLEADDAPAKTSPRATLIDGKLSSRKCHIYCSVFGCLTNDLENPELSFFKIPVETERRIQWLQLILREDLMEKTTINRVCEIHFSQQDIRKSMRKTLKNNALPCLNLPNKLKEDKQTQTVVETAVSSSQTDRTAVSSTSNQTERTFLVSDNETQTPASLSADSRKRKVKSDLNCRKRVKEIENDQTEAQVNMFHELCDRFLSSDLAELVKAQTNLRPS